MRAKANERFIRVENSFRISGWMVARLRENKSLPAEKPYPDCDDLRAQGGGGRKRHEKDRQQN
jgi:hypothetical protein